MLNIDWCFVWIELIINQLAPGLVVLLFGWYPDVIFLGTIFNGGTHYLGLFNSAFSKFFQLDHIQSMINCRNFSAEDYWNISSFTSGQLHWTCEKSISTGSENKFCLWAKRQWGSASCQWCPLCCTISASFLPLDCLFSVLLIRLCNIKSCIGDKLSVLGDSYKNLGKSTKNIQIDSLMSFLISQSLWHSSRMLYFGWAPLKVWDINLISNPATNL